MKASSLAFGLVCALIVTGIRTTVHFVSAQLHQDAGVPDGDGFYFPAGTVYQPAIYKWLSVRNNSVELFGLAGKPDGGIQAFDATVYCPDGGCKTVFVPAGTTFYSTDGGMIGVYYR